MKTPSNRTRAVAKGKVVHKGLNVSFVAFYNVACGKGWEDSTTHFWNKVTCKRCLKLKRGKRGK